MQEHIRHMKNNPIKRIGIGQALITSGIILQIYHQHNLTITFEHQKINNNKKKKKKRKKNQLFSRIKQRAFCSFHVFQLEF